MRGQAILFALLVVIGASSALYFHIGETERKCFIEEIPDETTVIGNHICSLIRILECIIVGFKGI